MGDDRGDRLAGVAHLVVGERWHRRRNEPGQARERDELDVAEVGPSPVERREHAVAGQCRRDVDRADRRVRMRAAQEGHVAHPRQGDVGDEASGAGQQPAVLLAHG